MVGGAELGVLLAVMRGRMTKLVGDLDRRMKPSRWAQILQVTKSTLTAPKRTLLASRPLSKAEPQMDPNVSPDPSETLPKSSLVEVHPLVTSSNHVFKGPKRPFLVPLPLCIDQVLHRSLHVHPSLPDPIELS